MPLFSVKTKENLMEREHIQKIYYICREIFHSKREDINYEKIHIFATISLSATLHTPSGTKCQGRDIHFQKWGCIYRTTGR